MFANNIPSCMQRLGKVKPKYELVTDDIIYIIILIIIIIIHVIIIIIILIKSFSVMYMYILIY